MDEDRRKIQHTEAIMDDRGELTQEFRDELEYLGEREIDKLELEAKNTPTADLFGVDRKKCEACKDKCPGYQPQGVLCVNPKSELEFPTFCTNCGCPACFHQLIKPKS